MFSAAVCGLLEPIWLVRALHAKRQNCPTRTREGQTMDLTSRWHARCQLHHGCPAHRVGPWWRPLQVPFAHPPSQERSPPPGELLVCTKELLRAKCPYS